MTLHINARNGICGNMAVAALIDLGADRKMVLRSAEEAASNLTKTKSKLSIVQRDNVTALYVETICEDKSFSIDEIKTAINAADIQDKRCAIAILDTLIEAEQKYHKNKHIHFHEIGCADLVFDIVGTVKALELLGETDITSTPVSVGGGKVTFSHGTLDVPLPATKEILEKYRIPYEKGPVDRELATPTGVAILANIVGRYVEYAPVTQTGFGAGSKYNGMKNILEVSRVVQGKEHDHQAEKQE